MAKPFNVELLLHEAPGDAQARAAATLTEPARAIGLHLKTRATGELDYRPRIKYPLLMTLWHNLEGEKMTVTFEPDDGKGTHVTISGVVAGGKHAMAADPEHWSEALGGSPT